MEFNFVLKFILRRFPPGNWVPLGRTVEGGLKNADFFTGVQCPLLHILLINAAIITGTVSSGNVVFRREEWDAFTSAHHSL